MKKTLLIILGVLLVLIVIGVVWYFFNQNENQATDDQFKDWKTYTNTEYGFEIKYPEDWSLLADENGIEINPADGENFNVNFGIDFDKRSMSEIENVYAKNGSVGKDVRIDNISARQYSSDPNNGAVDIFFSKNGQTFRVLLFRPDIDPFINQILSTFKFQECANDLECMEIVCPKGGAVHERCIDNKCILNAKCPK